MVGTNTAAVSVSMADLLGTLRDRRWTLFIFGPRERPELIAATYQWLGCADVIIIRAEEDASAYRVPLRPDSDDGPFQPRKVLWQYHANALWTLRAVLTVGKPGDPDAPRLLEDPHPYCFLPTTLPRPHTIRPLSQNSRPFPGSEVSR